MMFFFEQNILVKLCHQDDFSNQENQTDRSCWKHLGRESLSLDILMDALLLTDNDSKLRLPLSCLVSYKGFRALAVVHSDLESFAMPKVGFSHGRYFQDISASLKDQLDDIG